MTKDESLAKGLETSDRVKPCPFCGGEAILSTLEDEDNFGGDVICCQVCQASSAVEFGRKETILVRWNRRTSIGDIELLRTLKAILAVSERKNTATFNVISDVARAAISKAEGHDNA